MRPSVLTMVTLVAASSAYAFPRTAMAVENIPYTDSNGGLIEVPASVDGSAPVPMLVDLGAGVDVLSRDLGLRYVRVNGKYVTLRLSGQRADLPIGSVDSLAIGGVPIEAPHVGIWRGLDGSRVAGLVSATAFRNIATTFDFRDRQIVIEDAQTFPERIRNAIRVPLVLQDDLGISLALFARFDFGDGKTGLCEIDTGAQGITLDKTFAAANGLDPNGAATGAVAQVALDGAPQTAIDRPTVSFADLIYDCDVGNSFWQGRTFTLDLPNRRMYVTTSL